MPLSFFFEIWVHELPKIGFGKKKGYGESGKNNNFAPCKYHNKTNTITYKHKDKSEICFCYFIYILTETHVVFPVHKQERVYNCVPTYITIFFVWQIQNRF